MPLDRAFANHDVPLTQNSAFYLNSDGLIDQVGGEKRRAFGRKRIIALFEEQLARSLAEHRDAIMAAFTAYQGDEMRRDDGTLLGFRMHSCPSDWTGHQCPQRVKSRHKRRGHAKSASER